MKTNKKQVVVNGVTYYIVKPNAKHQAEAKLESNKAFSKAIKENSPVRTKLRELMEAAGVWDKDTDVEVKSLQDKLNDAEKKLAKGAKSGLSKQEARTLALDMRLWRNQLLNLRLIETEYDSKTADAFADNAAFDYLVSACVFDEEGRPVFSSLEDYRSKSEEEYAAKCAEAVAELQYGQSFDFTKDLPENLFLGKYKFVDEAGRLVNEDGHLIDVSGHLINDKGWYVNKEGQRVDLDGNRLSDEGNIIDPEFEEFTD